MLLAMIGLMVVGWFIKGKAEDFAADMEKDPARTMAELMVKTNPDVELVQTNEDDGTLTIRDKKTGEEMTLSFSEVEQGKFSVKTEDGEAVFEADGEKGTMRFSGKDGEETVIGEGDVDDVPDWVLRYKNGEHKSVFSTKTKEQSGWSLMTKTTDKPKDVVDWFEKKLEADGFKIEAKTTMQGVAMVSASDEKARRTVSVTATESPDGADVAIVGQETAAQ
jgi:hypothetical protein